MKQGVSLMVTNTEGMTIAAMISSIADRNSPILKENSSCSLFHLRAAISHSAGLPEELFDKESDLKKLYYIDYITVHPDYRRIGIASKLISFSLEVKKKHHHTYEKVVLVLIVLHMLNFTPFIMILSC